MPRTGFTLLELMIVVAIIGFLATMAIPRYTTYFDKARQAEVALQLASLHAAQQSYYAIHGKYSSKLSGSDSVGWQPEGYNGGGANARFYYTYGFNVPGAREGIHYFTGKLGASKKALGKTHADNSSFCAGAAAHIARTNKDDVWTIDETRNVIHVSSGI